MGTWERASEKVSRVFWLVLEATEEVEMLQSRQTMKKHQTPDDSLNSQKGQS